VEHRGYELISQATADAMLTLDRKHVEQIIADSEDKSRLVVPDKFTVLGVHMFLNATGRNVNNVNSVFLPDSIVSIFESACERARFTEINFPKSLKFMYGWAFESCNLIRADLSKCVHLKHISAYAFQDSSLEQIFFPPLLESIGAMAFENTWIKEIYLPDSVKNIESDCFANTNLTSVSLSVNVETISPHAFASCPDTLCFTIRL